MSATPPPTPDPPANDHQLFLKVHELLTADVVPAEQFPVKRPLLAHYTSLETIEEILKNDEVWFSNPAFMNDVEELKFGMTESLNAFQVHAGIADACGTDIRRKILTDRIPRSYLEYEEVHDFDTYVFCFSERKKDDTDGLLSMWRGYGRNGTGIAFVVDTGRINLNPASPFLIAPSNMRLDRREGIGLGANLTSSKAFFGR